jgi:hypothetical protein
LETALTDAPLAKRSIAREDRRITIPKLFLL